MAGEQREVDEREDVVHRGVVLGDAERPADHCAVRPGVSMGGVADGLRIEAGLFGGDL